jgi:hypothetical protein
LVFRCYHHCCFRRPPAHNDDFSLAREFLVSPVMQNI